MTITEIKQQEKNKECFNIFIDGVFSFSADSETIYLNKISEGMQLNQEQLEEIILKATYKKALNYAIYILAKSDKAENEVINKLKQKQYNDITIEKVINRLKELNYINDERYAQKWVKFNLGKSNINKNIILNKLLQKGLDKNLIEEIIEKSAFDEFPTALNLAQKKIRTLKGTDREKKAKLLNYLYSKGYASEICYRVINEMCFDETDIWED